MNYQPWFPGYSQESHDQEDSALVYEQGSSNDRPRSRTSQDGVASEFPVIWTTRGVVQGILQISVINIVMKG